MVPSAYHENAANVVKYKDHRLNVENRNSVRTQPYLQKLLWPSSFQHTLLWSSAWTQSLESLGVDQAWLFQMLCATESPAYWYVKRLTAT